MNRRFSPDEVDYVICGCASCSHKRGTPVLYDGVVVYVLKDGTAINRFHGENTERELMVNALIRSLPDRRAS